MTRAIYAAVVLLLAAALCGCTPKQPNETPEGAVRELVEQLKRLDGTQRAARPAFELLSGETKQNLIARAERYSRASGKHIEPEMMLAEPPFTEVSSFLSSVENSSPRNPPNILVPLEMSK